MKTTILSAAIFGLAAATTIPVSVQKRDSDTENDLVDEVCKTVTVIFARGTLESGNVGSLAGPPFFDALDTDLGTSNVALQGVDYGAAILGYLEGGDPAGAATLANLTNLAVTQCPDTQIMLSGYRYAVQSMLM
jgi:cutinase